MSNIIAGSRVVIISGPYKSRTGSVTRVHSTFVPKKCYSVELDRPAEIEVVTSSGWVGFNKHSTTLAYDHELKLLTDLGEAIYGEETDKETV